MQHLTQYTRYDEHSVHGQLSQDDLQQLDDDGFDVWQPTRAVRQHIFEYIVHSFDFGEDKIYEDKMKKKVGHFYELPTYRPNVYDAFGPMIDRDETKYVAVVYLLTNKVIFQVRLLSNAMSSAMFWQRTLYVDDTAAVIRYIQPFLQQWNDIIVRQRKIEDATAAHSFEENWPTFKHYEQQNSNARRQLLQQLELVTDPVRYWM